MEAYDPYGDYESIASMQRWLYVFGGGPKVYLKLHFDAARYRPESLEYMLAHALENMAQNGVGTNESFLLTRPYAEFRGAPCINLSFHGPPTVLCSDADP